MKAGEAAAKSGIVKGKRKPRTQRKAGGRRVLTIVPPEGVPFDLRLASLFARTGAQIIDIIITVVSSLLLLLALGLTGSVDFDTAQAIASLIFLFIGTPYYIIAELLSNGRTPGKRMLGIRVVAVDGGGLSVHRIVVRNLMKEIEIFTPILLLFSSSADNLLIPLMAILWLIVVIIFPAVTRHSQRIGDLIAGTAVIAKPSAALLPDLASQSATIPSAERFVFTPAQMDLYGAYELQVLEQLLRGERNDVNRPRLSDVAMRIRRKIGYEETVAPHEEEEFLQAFYIAQRGYLEQKKLFGDARADKYHDAQHSDAS
ncbi:RDD family protein [Martelella mediterranea]|uniref:Putative RDD family membrane protein YckC n=1 Tax=Martelella mediterranea TaxID=293089 RepID=A0A4V2V3P7_9HYPH|nr:RDD family protein [Martelella mediterranea]TCT34795.1 putative RDD family membrane protein YckC [Martelella mediterranea]